MKKLFILLAIMTLFALDSSFAQSTKYGWLAKESWNLGFGGVYSRYQSTSVSQGGLNSYGGFLSIQRNYSEHIGLRLKGSYIMMKGEVGTPAVEVTNNVIVGDLDLLYYLVPCEPISPYLGVGFGVFYNTVENSPSPELNESALDYQFNALFGAEWTLGEHWKLKTELAYHSVNNSKFDGTYGATGGGMLGNPFDSYMTFDLGFNYYFGYGDKSNICDIYEGLGKVDYDKIEEIVKRNATPPAEPVDYTRIEDIVKKHQSTGTGTMQDKWVLIGVNFDFNKASIRPESLPILYNAAEILLTNTDIRVEIQGHSDNVGSEGYNQKLSLERAESVKNFLVAKGVDAGRLTTVGVGESQPIMDNNTADGRALNRRIEFKVNR